MSENNDEQKILTNLKGAIHDLNNIFTGCVIILVLLLIDKYLIPNVK